MSEINILKGKLKHALKLKIEIDNSNQKYFGCKFSTTNSPPFISWIEKDYSIYKNPDERLAKDLEKLFNFMQEQVNEYYQKAIENIVIEANDKPTFFNGFTGEELHDVEAIDIITSKEKRIRVWQKFIFPEKKEPK